MKRLIAAMAAAIMLFSVMTACGERRDKTDASPKPAAVTATAKAAKRTEATPTPLLDTDKTLESILPDDKENETDKAVEKEENRDIKNDEKAAEN